MYNKLLNTFILASDYGSFTKAAEKLYISTTAIMKQINQLEEHIGFPLFERSSHGLRLTKAGESIYKDAKNMIAYSDEAISRAKQLFEQNDYSIRIGTSLLNPCKVLMDLWAQVTNKHPEFRIQIVPFDDDNSQIIEILSSLGQKFDIIVGACGSKHWLTHSNIYNLGKYHVCCAVGRKHRLASRKKLHIRDLYGETIIMAKRGDTDELDQLRKEIEQNHPKIQIEDTTYFYDINVFNQCENSNKLLLTHDKWTDVHPSLVTIPVDWDYTIPYGLIYAMKPSKDVIEFIKAIKDI